MRVTRTAVAALAIAVVTLAVAIGGAGAVNIDYPVFDGFSFGEMYHVAAALCLNPQLTVRWVQEPVGRGNTVAKLNPFVTALNVARVPGAVPAPLPVSGAVLQSPPANAMGTVTAADDHIAAAFTAGAVAARARIIDCFVPGAAAAEAAARAAKRAALDGGLHNQATWIHQNLPFVAPRQRAQAAAVGGVLAPMPAELGRYVLLWSRLSAVKNVGAGPVPPVPGPGGVAGANGARALGLAAAVVPYAVPAYEVYRNTHPTDMLALIAAARARGLTPVLMGDFDATVIVPGHAIACIDLRRRPAGMAQPIPYPPEWGAAATTYTSQLAFFYHLIQTNRVVGQIGGLSGGMDAAALMGMPTVQFADHNKADRMEKWGGRAPRLVQPAAGNFRGYGALPAGRAHAVPNYHVVLVPRMTAAAAAAQAAADLAGSPAVEVRLQAAHINAAFAHFGL